MTFKFDNKNGKTKIYVKGKIDLAQIESIIPKNYTFTLVPVKKDTFLVSIREGNDTKPQK